MLEQTGLHLAAFPAAPFRLTNWTMHGHHCILDKAPDRMLDIQVSFQSLACACNPGPLRAVLKLFFLPGAIFAVAAAACIMAPKAVNTLLQGCCAALHGPACQSKHEMVNCSVRPCKNSGKLCDQGG